MVNLSFWDFSATFSQKGINSIHYIPWKALVLIVLLYSIVLKGLGRLTQIRILTVPTALLSKREPSFDQILSKYNGTHHNFSRKWCSLLILALNPL